MTRILYGSFMARERSANQKDTLPGLHETIRRVRTAAIPAPYDGSGGKISFTGMRMRVQHGKRVVWSTKMNRLRTASC